MGRKVALGMILAALSAGIGGGVAIAATQNTAKHAKTPAMLKTRAVAHHCHGTSAVSLNL